MSEFEGQFEVYANSKQRREKYEEDLLFAYSIPEIKVMQNGTDIFAMSDLDVTVPVDVELRGFSDLSDESPALIIAQYKGDRLLYVEVVNDAAADCTEPGNEIKKSFEVKAEVDNIKVMYMNISNAKPFIASYDI